MATNAFSIPEAIQIREASLPIFAAYGGNTLTDFLNVKGKDQIIFDIRFTPDSMTTILYMKVVFREKLYRLKTIPSGGGQQFQTQTAVYEQQILDITGSTITAGVQTVGLNTLEYKIDRATTGLITIQLPVKTLSYEVALNIKADNPGMSQLDIWAVTGIA